jgi:excisionase family DNA binding protein
MSDDATPATADALEPLLTLEQAARYLNVSKASLRRWTNDGRLACHRVGVRQERRFARADLDAHVGRPRAAHRQHAFDASLAPMATMERAARHGEIPHVSLYFQDDADLWRLVRPYLLGHLRARLPIVYICDSVPRETLRERLRGEGYEPETLEASGMLRLLTAPEAYLRTGTFSADGMIAFMEAAILETRAAGYDAAMLSGEMTWYFTGAPGVEEMIEYEARLNGLMRRYPGITIVCSYDLRRFDGRMVVDSLCAHPYAQLPDRLVRGFFG